MSINNQPIQDRLLQSHENRIIELETLARDNAVTLAGHTQHLDELSTQIESGVLSLSSKLEDTIKPLSEAIARMDATLLDGVRRVQILEDNRAERERLLKEAEEKVMKRRAQIKAVFWSGLGAAILAFIKDAIPALLKYIRQ